MIYKSFIRKKTTKIYLFIDILILTIFAILILGKNHYLKLYNENYQNSFLAVPYNTDNYTQLKEIKNILKIEIGVMEDNIFLISNSKLQENEIILPTSFYLPSK